MGTHCPIPDLRYPSLHFHDERRFERVVGEISGKLMVLSEIIGFQIFRRIFFFFFLVFYLFLFFFFVLHWRNWRSEFLFVVYLLSKGIEKYRCNRWISRFGLVKFWILKSIVYYFGLKKLNGSFVEFYKIFLNEIFIEEIGAMNFSHF